MMSSKLDVDDLEGKNYPVRSGSIVIAERAGTGQP